jgi:hypothetical protein
MKKTKTKAANRKTKSPARIADLHPRKSVKGGSAILSPYGYYDPGK